MKTLDGFLRQIDLRDPDDIDALLELASFARDMISERRYQDICGLISHCVRQSLYEAFTWTLGILQEEFEKDQPGLEPFECDVGRSIPDYDEFIGRLRINFDVLQNDYEALRDENGETKSFFNIFKYNTRFSKIYLISSENFDTRDNDYIQYRLLFAP